MKALRDIYKLKVGEPFKQLFTQGMITHKTYITEKRMGYAKRRCSC